ncbi:MAG: hypothetical protein NXI04_07065 [Planctomycetaceae bacterium]|nr:hypothetical protein [Planctomycetaceae bacterium]
MRSDLISLNCQRNQETAGLADSYASHREHVMRLVKATVSQLSPDTGKCSSVVLLGSGNCHDVDLTQLAELFDAIHMVDVDDIASREAVAVSGVDESQVTFHAPQDIAEPLMSLTSRDFEPEEENREHCINVLQALSSENGVADVPEADVVLSLCVYTQLVDSLAHIVHREHPAFQNALKAVRIGHLRRLVSMLRTGGVAIFVTDVVSSLTAPELNSATEDSLPDIIRDLVSKQNFFTGTSPAMVLNDLNVLSRLPSGPETVHTIDPWIWNLADRRYAVYALRIQKRIPLPEVEMPAEEFDQQQPGTSPPQ